MTAAMDRPLPQDACLPALAAAFDAGRMRGVLEASIAAAGAPRARVRQCALQRVKYRPGRNCLFLYRALIEEPDEGRVEEQYFKACLYGPGEVAGRFRAAQEIARARPRYGRPVERIAGLDMVLWGFPNDRKLGALPRLTDPAALRGTVEALAAGRFGRGARVKSLRLQPAAYFPEHSYAVAVHAELAGREAPWTLYAKTRADERGDAVLAAMEALWNAPARREGRLVVARPLVYGRAHRLLWQEAAPGRPLEHLAGDGRNLARHMGPLGAAVAALHGTPVPGVPALGAADRLQQLREAARVLGRACPRLEARLAKLVGCLTATLPACRNPVTLHGDLHMNNVLIGEGEGAALVDFDGISAGPAALELGGFVAGLIYRGLLHGTPADAVAGAVAALLAAYRRHGAQAPDTAELAWHAAAALVQERAFRCLTSLKPGRYELVEPLVDEALACALGRGAKADFLAAA